MFRQTNIFGIILLSVLFVLSGCNEENSIITSIPAVSPEDYDWEFQILDLFDSNQPIDNTYALYCTWLGDGNGITENDVITVQFNGGQLRMLQHVDSDETGMFMGQAQLNPGISYMVEIFKNGILQSEGTIKTPYRAIITYPTHYDSNTSAEITWTLSNNSQYQVAKVVSYSSDYVVYDEKYEYLSPASRKYTVPVNAVLDSGEGGRYSIRLMQANFSKRGRTAFIAMQGLGRFYYPSTKEAIPITSLLLRNFRQDRRVL